MSRKFSTRQPRFAGDFVVREPGTALQPGPEKGSAAWVEAVGDYVRPAASDLGPGVGREGWGREGLGGVG